MSQKPPMDSGSSLRAVKVEPMKGKIRRHTHGEIFTIDRGNVPKVSSMSSDYVYVNSAYSGSLNSISERRISVPLQPPTSVIREQYWTCSKWPFGQRVLAVAVGVLLGAVLSLALTIVLRSVDSDDGSIGGIFRKHPAPATE